MLKKLFWRDVKLSAKVMLPLYGAMMAAALVMRLGADHFYRDMDIMITCLELGAFILTPLILFAVFYKRLFGDESNFTFSIPVDNRLHIWSKVLVTVVYFGISGIVCLLAFGVMTRKGNGLLDLLLRELEIKNSAGGTSLVHLCFWFVTATVLIFAIAVAIYAAGSFKYRWRSGGLWLPIVVLIGLLLGFTVISQGVAWVIDKMEPYSNIVVFDVRTGMGLVIGAFLVIASSYILLRRNYSRCPNID